MAAEPLDPLEQARTQEVAGDPGRRLLAQRQALLAQPERAELWAEHGRLLLALGRTQEAQEACRRALALDPGQGPARLDLARSLIRTGDLVAAQEALAPATVTDPGNPEVTTLLIHVLIRRSDWPALRREMLRRIDADFTGAEAEWERSCVNLAFGVMPQGFDQQEARWRLPFIAAHRLNFGQPLWNGEPFPGRTLLLHWEQGFGDTLMFVRYAALAKARGGRVLVLAQPELAALVATCPGVDGVIADGQALPAFDLQLPLMSLPRVFRTELGSIPAPIPYLDVPARVTNRERIARLLAGSAGRTRVGLSWAGSASHTRDGQRSIPAASLAKLRDLPGVAWHSFQYGSAAEPPFPGVLALAPLLGDFSDTAYALSGMDLVITVDTALAHLAGAMGIPTLLLVSYLPDWRWMLGRDDSPWYPTLRIYRQALSGDWEPVIDRVLADLAGA